MSTIDDAENLLLASGKIDEGIAVADLQKEVVRLRALVQSTVPVCPHCKTTMVASTYKGYYDTFSYWECNCDTLPGAHVVKGAFA